MSIRSFSYTAQDGEARFLICTDVAARGIDIRGLPYVINMTLPASDEKESYVHRIGRVGRADRMGLAIAIVATVREKVMLLASAIFCELLPIWSLGSCIFSIFRTPRSAK